MLLARKGYRVLLVDRATFPSDTISTHYIHHISIARLKRWGLLDKVVASNCPPIRKWIFDVEACALIGAPPSVDGVTEAYSVRRPVLDKILVDAAVDAGVEFREAFSVEELVMEGSHVTGIRGHSLGGSSVTETARVVIGADGRNSLVARTVQAPAYNTHPAFTFIYYAYWSGVPTDALEAYLRKDLGIVVFPTNDGLTCVSTSCPHKDFHAFRSDIEGNFWKQLERVPEFAERVRAGKREERFLGTGDLPHFFRKPYGPGWALVGDAGYNKDPLNGEGITDAFRDAELLVGAIDKGFCGQQPLDQALADYERERNEVAMPVYELVNQAAALEVPSAEQMQLFHALRESPTDISRFFGTISQVVPVSEFFAPENIQRILEGRSIE
jgi:2-polyprenyl-6-methoxyphenol hydroxylase-like FAD-dependent oxidoreductase